MKKVVEKTGTIDISKELVLLNETKELVILTQADYESAIEKRKLIKSAEKKIKEKQGVAEETPKLMIKKIRAEYEPLYSRVNEVLKLIDSAVMTYTRALEAEREKEAKKIEKKIEKAEAKGDESKVESLSMLKATYARPAAPQAKGSYTKKYYYFRIERPDLVPAEFRKSIPDEEKIKTYNNENSGKGKIPGVVFWTEEKLITISGKGEN